MNRTDEYVTPRELAEHRGVTEDLVRFDCREGKIDGARLHGRSWRIPARHLDTAGAPDEWVSVRTVADHFGVTGEAIRQKCRAGTIENVRVGGRFKIDRAVFDQLVSNGMP